MHSNQKQPQHRWIHWISFLSVFLVILGNRIPLSAQDRTAEIAGKLNGFDAFVEKVMTDWNAPGMGVGIVVNDQLVFAKGYGYRDFEKKLPFTTSTLCPIGSNTKLFTAIAAGLLVTEGKLSWDQPIRENAPWLRFNTSELNNSVTLRDMLAHRTGLSRTDFAWYRSDFTSREMSELVKYIEPKTAIRQTFIYNNFMYVAAGQIIESQSGQPWESFVRSRILTPLEMNQTGFTIADLEREPDHAIPVMETRDGGKLYRLPFYRELQGIAPAGAIHSNVEELSHWVIALLNDGMYRGRQILPASVLKATLEPAIVC
ncbi:MAG TPA: serine hydrolase domain-containing protein, partial [Acidobacteriota bacterium]|nr:serine hydrolase domain-containing protein [Acidobacteriota bacterium]